MIVDSSVIAEALCITARGVRKKADREGWPSRTEAGIGGQKINFFLKDLPEAVQAKVILHLHKTGQIEKPAPAEKAPVADFEWTPEHSRQLWDWAKTRTQKQRDKGAEKATLLMEVQALMYSKTVSSLRDALALVAETNGVSEGSLRRWWYDGAKMGRSIDAFPQKDWAVLLIPRHGSVVVTGAEIHPSAWDFYCRHYLTRSRKHKVTWTDAYERTVEAANKNGWEPIPSESTFKRRLQREFTPQQIIYEREGIETLMKMYPPQRRDKTMFAPGEAVNGDGLKLDSFYVKFPDGEVVSTPTGWFWQDIRTGKILAYRLGKTENTDLFRLATYDLTAVCSPAFAWIDNTRVAANKAMTGRAFNRRRFKNRDNDPLGLLKHVGIDPRFTDPSQKANKGSRPVERAFGKGGVHEKVRTNPRLRDRGFSVKTAVTFEEFAAVVAEEVARFNAKKGRRTPECHGVLSFDELFEQLFSASEVRLIPESKRSMLLLMPEVVRVSKTHFEVKLKAGKGPMGAHRYSHENLSKFMGQEVVVYYDPADFTQDVTITRIDGAFITKAHHMADVGFNDTESAREWAKEKARFEKATKKANAAQIRMEAQELAALYPEAEAAEIPEPGIIALDFTRKRLEQEQEPLPKVANGEEGGLHVAERYMNEVIQLPRRTEDDEF